MMKNALILLLLISGMLCRAQQGMIQTVAGNGIAGFSGDGGAATAASFNAPNILAVDANNNIYIGDGLNYRVRKLTTDGMITTIAGNGVRGRSGDGGLATDASLGTIGGLAVDHSGNLLITDLDSGFIRKVTAAGVITTIAGTGYASIFDDPIGLPATVAPLDPLGAIAVGRYGEIFVEDASAAARLVIDTTGFVVYPDVFPSSVTGLAVDAMGNQYFEQVVDGFISKSLPFGDLQLVTSHSSDCWDYSWPYPMTFLTDTEMATSVCFNVNQDGVWGISADDFGNLYLASTTTTPGPGCVLEIDGSGRMFTVAGRDSTGFSGDGGPASRAVFNNLWNVCADHLGNLYVADAGNNRIRKINALPSLCIGDTTRLQYVAYPGGVWKSGNTSVATIDSVSGLVTGIAQGRCTITYIVDSATIFLSQVQIKEPPQPIAGIDTILCTSAFVSGSVQLHDSALNGVWSCSTPSIAEIEPTTGQITSFSSGYDTFYYRNGCGTPVSYATHVIAAAVPHFTITQPDCSNNLSYHFSSAAIVDTPTGAPHFWWTFGDSAWDTGTIVNHTFPFDGGYTVTLYDSISGNFQCVTSSSSTMYLYPSIITDSFRVSDTTICVGHSVEFIGPMAFRWLDPPVNFSNYQWRFGDGSTLSSTSTSCSHIYHLPGDFADTLIITTATGCYDTIYYGKNAGSTASQFIHVGGGIKDSLKAIYSGSCAPLSVTFIDDTHDVFPVIKRSITYGTLRQNFYVTDTTLTFPMGSYPFHFSDSDMRGCTTSQTFNIAVYPVIGPDTVLCADSLCVGDTIVLALGHAATGLWSVSDTSLAHLSGLTQILTTTDSGLLHVYFSASNLCDTVVSSKVVQIKAPPTNCFLTGDSVLCTGSSITLSGFPTGGTWSCSVPSVASIADGIITAISAGNTVVSFTQTNICGSVSSTKPVSVMPLAFAGVLFGADSVCIETSNSYLTSSSAPGIWTLSETSIASINDSTGNLYALSSGTDTIRFTTWNRCDTSVATKIVHILQPPIVPVVISPALVCMGVPFHVDDSLAGGAWFTDGMVLGNTDDTITGISAGTGMLTYTVTNMCGPTSTTLNIAVDSVPHVLVTGTHNFVCIGGGMILDTLAGAPTGGSWSSQDSNIVSVSATGIVQGMQVDSANIVYQFSNVCGIFGDTFRVAVIPFPSVINIAGPDFLCVGTHITLTDTTGLWINSWSQFGGQVSDSGTSSLYVLGLSAGTDVLTYSATNVCGTSSTEKVLTIYPAVLPGPITGPTMVCVDSIAVLSDSVSGSWLVANGNATVNSGNVRGVTAGLDTIYFTTTDACMQATTVQTIISVEAQPTPIISRTGSILSSTGGYYAYQWYYNGTLIPGATNDFYVIYPSDTGVYEESVISYAGCSGSGFYYFHGLGVTNTPQPPEYIRVFPNPGSGEFMVEVPIKSGRVSYRVSNIAGIVLIAQDAELLDRRFTIRLDDLANGTYILEVMQAGVFYKQVVVVLK